MNKQTNSEAVMRDALKMAIEYLTNIQLDYKGHELRKACKEALEQPVCIKCGKPTQQGECFYGCRQEQPAQEPVGDAHYYCSTIERCLDDLPDEYLKLHRNFLKDVVMTIRNTHPAPLQNEFAKTKSWQGLSDDEIKIIQGGFCKAQYYVPDLVRAIEQALKEKNT